MISNVVYIDVNNIYKIEISIGVNRLESVYPGRFVCYFVRFDFSKKLKKYKFTLPLPLASRSRKNAHIICAVIVR